MRRFSACLCVATLASLAAGDAVALASASTQSCEVQSYPIAGTPLDEPFRPHGPGLVLNGGGSWGVSSLKWMAKTIRGNERSGGDVVFLTAMPYSDETVPTNRLRAMAGFNSVTSFRIPRCAAPSALAEIAHAIDRSQGVYIDGGKQSDYAHWRDSELSKAVDRLYRRGGVVGGVSAGLAVLGGYAYDSVAADSLHAYTQTSDAVENPFEPRISLSVSPFHFPALRDAITDTHLAARDRLGRMTVFMARLFDAGAGRGRPRHILGIGVDGGSAIVVDRHGVGRLVGDDADSRAYLVIGSRPSILRKGAPLVYRSLRMTILTAQHPRFDLLRWKSSAPWLDLDVDGRNSYYRPFNPYR